jgi:transcription antitermination factor NusG
MLSLREPQSVAPGPRNLVAPPSAELPAEYLETRWYAAYTCARHEKRVAEQLHQRDVVYFLPLYESLRRWADRRKLVQLPLFPGYVFVRIALKDRLQALEIPSVAHLVGFNGHPVPLPDAEVEAIRTCMALGNGVEPHPYLKVGRRARIIRGPLRGLEGVLQRRRGRCRFVISLELIMRSVAVEVEEADLSPSS